MEETCKKKVIHSMRDVGITHKTICGKPVYREGMCKHHYTNYRRKMTPWGERREYREITLEEMNRGKHFKLKHSHQHRLFRVRFGIIQEYYGGHDAWFDTDMVIDPEKYCVKK